MKTLGSFACLSLDVTEKCIFFSGISSPLKLRWWVATDSYLIIPGHVHFFFHAIPGMARGLRCGLQRGVLLRSKSQWKRRQPPQKERSLFLHRLIPRLLPRIRPSFILFMVIIQYALTFPIVGGETGYDCSKVDNPIATFSLSDVAECPPFRSAYKAPEATNVQILQSLIWTVGKTSFDIDIKIERKTNESIQKNTTEDFVLK